MIFFTLKGIICGGAGKVSLIGITWKSNGNRLLSLLFLQGLSICKNLSLNLSSQQHQTPHQPSRATRKDSSEKKNTILERMRMAGQPVYA